MSESWIEAWLDHQAFERFEVTEAGQTRYRASYLVKLENQGAVLMNAPPQLTADERRRVVEDIEAFSGSVPPWMTAPAPTLTLLTPDRLPQGDLAVTVTLTGTGFVRETVATFDNFVQPTVYVSDTELTVTVLPTDISIRQVAVRNATKISNTLPLEVFHPLVLPSLIQWIDTADLTTYTYSSGNEVSAIADKSGIGNDLAQGTLAAQPDRLDGNLNGAPVLHFAANESIGGTLTFTPTDPGLWELFIVPRNEAMPVSDGSYYYYLAPQGIMPANNGPAYQWLTHHTGGGWSFSTAPTDTVWHVIEMRIKRDTPNTSGGSGMDLVQDGVWCYGGAGGVALTANPHVFISATATPKYVAEAVVYFTPNVTGLTAEQRTAVRDYLRTKHGLP